MPYTHDRLDADAFAKAVQHAEAANDPKAIAKLFAADATLEAPVRYTQSNGDSSAQGFWTQYLAAFETIESKFTHVHSTGDHGVLEWESTGTLKSGTPIRYKGVSIVEFADGKVQRFATYYDSAAFLPEGSKHAK